MAAMQYGWGDYYIPSTHTLRNLLGGDDHPGGVQDPIELERIELELVAIRMKELQTSPVPGKFDLAHMQAVHRPCSRTSTNGPERSAPLHHLTNRR